MLTKAITYTDINDRKQTVTYSFQLSKAELTAEVFRGKNGETLKDRIERLSQLTPEDMKRGAGAEIIDTYKLIVRAAVGVREDDLFLKDEDIVKRFMYSGAYDEFFWEMLNSGDSGASAIAAMMPADMRAEIAKTIDARMSERAAVLEQEKNAAVLQNSGTVETISTKQPKVDIPITTDDPKWMQERRYPTDAELDKMTRAELQRAFRAKSERWFD